MTRHRQTPHLMSNLKIKIRVTARAGRNAIDRWDPQTNTLYLRVAAVPSDGQANEAILQLLAKQLSVPKSRITLTGGATSRNKTYEIEDMEQLPEHILALRNE